MLPAKTDYPVIRSQLQAIGTRIKAQSNFQQTDSVQGIDRRRLPYGGQVCQRMQQIASDLGTNEITVKIHRGHEMRKMQADSLAELVRIAAKLELSPGKE